MWRETGPGTGTEGMVAYLRPNELGSAPALLPSWRSLVPSLVPTELEAPLGQALGLAGRTCLITGATSGIGHAVALGLARLGMNVVAVGRNDTALAELRALAQDLGLSLIPSHAEVTDEAQISASAALAISEFGGLHGVFANAGTAAVGPALDLPGEMFADVVATNLTGAFLTARAGARLMSEGGAVVFTSSSFARRGFVDWSPYNASKAGLAMLAETLAGEWAPRGITVHALAPTATLTNVNRALFEDEAFREGVIGGIPVGRLLTPEELVLPMAFLLSPRNQMMTGHTLYVDGGQSL